MNLDAYFHRIGWRGGRAATLETLRGLHRAHPQAIPFENLDVLLGRPIRLELGAIEQKLVHDRRGGYCFEHNALFAAVLRMLGFFVTPMIARVRWQVPAGVPTPTTHMILRVELAGEPWLADVGFGGIGLREPLRLDLESEQGPPTEARWLTREGDRLLHQVRLGGAWHDVYLFSLDEAAPIDFEVGNWYTSTHPNSRFRQNLIASRIDGDRRLAVFNREYTVRHDDGRVDRQAIGSPDELLQILREHFALDFPAATRFGSPGSAWPA